MLELNQCYNMDCMKGMAQFPDGFFDLAVVDPPYFSGPERRGYYGSKVSKIGVYRDYPVSPVWEIPGRAYFDELRRVAMYSKDSAFSRVLKLQEALYKVQGRIAKIADSLRALEESDRRMALEKQRLEILRMRATGAVDVPDPDGTAADDLDAPLEEDTEE